MKSRKFRPGDVAMVRGDCGDGFEVAIRAYVTDVDATVWWGKDGYWRDRNTVEVRPLVVIDPEDREQVERLMTAFADALGWGPHKFQRETYVKHLAAALREFADPKPPPCGASLTLGKDGALYRCAEGEGHDGPHADGTCIWTAVQP